MSVKALRMTEAAWQRQVCDLASMLGWQFVHFPTVTTARKGRDGAVRYVHQTAYKGPLGPGWPDLVLVRDRVVFVELKATTSLSEEQKRVRDILRDADAEWYCWRPADLEEARRVLVRR